MQDKAASMTMNATTLTMRPTVTPPMDTFFFDPDLRRPATRPWCIGVAVCVASLTVGAAFGSELIGPLPGCAPARIATPPVHHECRHEQPRHAAGCRGECRGGACAPHCPVKPEEFGFYETQWRPWPRSAAGGPADAATLTPAMPPRSEAPRVDEESLPRPSPLEGAAEADIAPLPTPRIPLPDRSTPPEAPPAERPSRAPPGAEPRGEGAAQEPAPLTPPAKAAPAKRSEDENLFDEARGRLPRAALLAMLSQKAARERAATAADGDELLLVSHEEGSEKDGPVPVAEPQREPARVPRSANPLRAAGSAGSINPLR